MSIASVAAQQGSMASSGNTSTAGTGASGSSASTGGLASLSGNFSQFLNLLMTQLQNQDPTSPLDANQFTTELVQFAGVQQQINTNSSLTQLIQLTQGQEVIQGNAMVGKQVAVTSNQLSLQQGSAQLRFSAPTAQPVEIAVTNSAGIRVSDNFVTAQAGSNTWTWNGSASNGSTLPDGAYTVAVTGGGNGGSATALPFQVIGTATGVQKQGNGLQLQLGALSVDFSAVQSVLPGS